MFSLPEGVGGVDATKDEQGNVGAFDMDSWHKSIGGQWEQVQAAIKAAKEQAAKAGSCK
jgi:hypothetical protein